MHQARRVQAEADPEMEGMATTATAALTAGFDGIIAHIGDSRAYQFRAGTLYRFTHDHTAAQQLVDIGILDSTAQAAEYLRHALVNCLGGKIEVVQVDTCPFRLADGDRLLLCTDGLTDMVDEEEMARVLTEHAEPQAACDVLVERALAHGGKDNVTVVLARYTAVS